MKKVISASRRTDLVAFFPDWLSAALQKEKALVNGPARRTFSVDLNPDRIHTIVLWSKNFANLLANRCLLRDLLGKYAQVYLHFTVTGLGGTDLEMGVPPPPVALRQLEPLLEIAGSPDRISLRFDPIVHWPRGNIVETNLSFFESLALRAAALGIRNIRFSFAQWYGKSRRRAGRHGFAFFDPPSPEKLRAAGWLAEIAGVHGIQLYSCSQDFLAAVPGIRPSACIDGRLLQALHPSQEAASLAKDRTQRRECHCTESADIGSYTQTCPHCCVYCYANPRL